MTYIEDMPAQARRRASGDRPRRRVDGRRADRRRPPRDPHPVRRRDRRPPDRQCARDGQGRRRARDRSRTISRPKCSRARSRRWRWTPIALNNAAARALSVGRPHAARDLADLVERVRRRPFAASRSGPRSARVGARSLRREACQHDEGDGHRHRHDPFRRHRRDRHVGHRRGHAPARLQGAGLRRLPTATSSRSCARTASRSAIGHSPDNLGDAAVVVCSTAIKDSNPEIQAAAERRLPRVRRAEMLAELMRMQKTVAVAGTHGKTTTTSMIAALLDSGGVDPTVINGGIINRYGSNARLGKSDWWVIEADESDGSFLRLDGTHRRRHQHRSRASRTLRRLRRGQGRLRRVRRERAVLRARGAVRRSSRGAEHHRPNPRPADRHLRLLGARRRSRRQCRRRSRAAAASTL